MYEIASGAATSGGTKLGVNGSIADHTALTTDSFAKLAECTGADSEDDNWAIAAPVRHPAPSLASMIQGIPSHFFILYRHYPKTPLTVAWGTPGQVKMTLRQTLRAEPENDVQLLET